MRRVPLAAAAALLLGASSDARLASAADGAGVRADVGAGAASRARAEGLTAARQPYPTDFQNNAYDGRFTFVRIRFTPTNSGGFGFGGGGGRGFGRDVKWNHDFPRAESHFMKIMEELSALDAVQGGGNVYGWDEPDVMRYPLAYQCEVGFWNPTEKEVEGMRAYFAKGGFVIFDDFTGPNHWETFVQGMRRVLPEGRLVQIPPAHPIFDSFFKIDLGDAQSRGRGAYGQPVEFWGVFEDNDPSKRLLFVANFNNDLGENWEFSDEPGSFPVDMTSMAYKLGVNYLMYGLTR
jgi:hypothetical protein